MDDFVKRKDVIEAFDDPAVECNYGDVNPDSVIRVIEAIPSADVRPVERGKWVQDCDYHFRCSVCGDRRIVSNGNPLDVANGWNYCPNCGANMRGNNE